jgi:ABC-type glycerol-3-phosphate transport system substrate-binding protein
MRILRGSRGVVAVLLAVTVVAAVWAAGGGEGAGAKPKVRIAHLWSQSPAAFGKRIVPEMEKFVQTNAGAAEYVLEGEQGDNLRNKIKLDLAANNLPDIFYYWSITSLAPMIEAKLLVDVNQYFAASKLNKAANFDPSGLAAYSLDGGKTAYAIPTTGFKDMFLVNKNMFKKFNLQYPKTYDDLLAVSKVFAGNGIIPLAVGSKGGNPSHFFHAELAYQFMSLEEADKFKTGEYKFNSPVPLQAAERVLELAKARVFPKDTIGSGDFGPAVALYNDEKAAMILAQTWSSSRFTQEAIDRSDFIVMPKITGAKYDPATFCVGNVNNGWAITKKGWDDQKKRQAMVAALDFLTSDDVYHWMAEGGAFIFKNIKLDMAKINTLYARQLEFTAKQKANTNFWSQMPDPVSQEVLSTTLDELWAQNISAKAFVDKVQASIDKAIKK